MKGNKVTLSDLLRRKEEKDRKNEVARVYVESFGGELELNRLPLAKFLDLLDGVTEKTGAGESLRIQMEIIYESCPILHNKELQEAYDCVEPTEIVGKIFDDNIGEIMTVLGAIFEMYGMDSGDIIDDLKN
jgi:hypothetical protein